MFLLNFVVQRRQSNFDSKEEREKTYNFFGIVTTQQRRLLSDWSIFPKAFTDQFHFRFGKARKSRQRF